MRSLNNVQLIGRLGRDVETKYTQTGKTVSNVSLCTSYKKRGGDNRGGDDQEITQWHNLTIWGMEGLLPYLVKGSTIYVQGRLEYEKYKNKDGVDVTAAKVIVEEIILLGGSQGQAGQQLASAPRGYQPSMPPSSGGYGYQAGNSPSSADPFGLGGLSDDDVPF